MTAIKTDNWFDIGHIDKYYDSKLEVQSREFNHIIVDKERGNLTKSSDDIEKFLGEIKWYLKLPSDLEYSRPRIFKYSLNYNSPFVSMEYYSYHTIHELFLYGTLEYQQWIDVFERIKFIINDYERYKLKDKKIKESLNEMYLEKTIKRLNLLKQNKQFQVFFDKQICINGVKYKSLNDIVEILKEIIPQRLYNIDEFNIIHGDLCFANIMIDSNLNFIKLIDPRGKFGKFDIYGDARYEMAKLFHSLDGGYDYIIKDLFDLEINNNNNINLKINKSNYTFNLFEIFKDVFKDKIKNNLEEIELIESLLFFSMTPLHKESKSHQIAMMCRGIQILDKIINIKE